MATITEIANSRNELLRIKWRAGGGLTPEQQATLDQLTERLNQLCPRVIDRDRQRLDEAGRGAKQWTSIP